jgi:hypothetical protein
VKVEFGLDRHRVNVRHDQMECGTFEPCT